MNFLFGSKEKEELALVFDIKSSSIGGALFLMHKSGTPKIIYSIREPIVLEKELDFDKFLDLTIKSLDIVVKKISLAGLGVPNKIFCILSSPWYGSETRTIVYRKNTPFIFNLKLADNLIQKEIQFFEEEYLAKYKHTTSKIKPIEFKNLKTLLNGYSTTVPLNQKVKELEMTIYISMGEEQVLDKMKETINKYFHSKNVIFSSFQMASFAVARDTFVHQEDFLLVDVGGEITDISMVKKDILRSSISFPIGRNYLVRKISKDLSCSIDEAKSLISLYKDGHGGEASIKRIEPSINKIRKDWLSKFQETLVKISNDISIPSVVFVTADQDIAQFFTETIKKEEFNQYTLTDSKFKVVYLSTQTLHGIVLFGENIPRDSFFIIESIYISRFLH